MKLISGIGIFKLPLPNECICFIMDYAFEQTHNHKQKITNIINTIINSGYNRVRVCKKFYEIWDDSEQDSFWLNVYKDKRSIVMQSENCVQCGNYRYTNCINILCTCPEFIEMYNELI